MRVGSEKAGSRPALALVHPTGVEPATPGTGNQCSSTELRVHWVYFSMYLVRGQVI